MRSGSGSWGWQWLTWSVLIAPCASSSSLSSRVSSASRRKCRVTNFCRSEIEFSNLQTWRLSWASIVEVPIPAQSSHKRGRSKGATEAAQDAARVASASGHHYGRHRRVWHAAVGDPVRDARRGACPHPRSCTGQERPRTRRGGDQRSAQAALRPAQPTRSVLRLSHLLALSAPPQPFELARSAGPAAMAAMEVMAWLWRRRQQVSSKQQQTAAVTSC